MNYFAVEGRLYQWDTGRKVTLTLPYDEYASVVEFSVNNEAEALVVSVVDNVAEIPNKLLQRSGSLRLWAVTIEENGRQTRRYGNLPIFPRAKPDDYVYTETEIMDYRKVAEDLAELVQRVEEIEENGVQGGGAVASVNGKTGEVYLNAADVGALPTTGGKLTGNLTVPRLISTAADADGNIYEVQLYPTANGGLYMPLRHNGAVANAMSMSQSATTFGKPVAISSGGHGGKNAAEGRQNLSLYSKEEIDEKITNTQKEIERLTEEIANEASAREKPLVYIDGAIPTTKDNVLAEMRVVSGWLNIHAYIKIKCQGTSSMSYPKKNFTVTLYQDEARTIPLYITIPGWKHASNKFVLKANWIDHLHARNIISAQLWSDVVASRPDYDMLPVELRNSPNNGAVDGFPIVVYTNGAYQGIYTWNIGKEDWLWGMDEDNPNHVLLCAETNASSGVFVETPCNFRALWSGVDETDWSVEVGTNSDAVKNSLNALISCVKDTDDATFKATIGIYLDLQSAIDYWIFQYVICGIDGLAKNMLLGTYDLKKWIMGAYDLDSTWGLYWDGTLWRPANEQCPETYLEPYSLLFERISKLFTAEVNARYVELRGSVLSYANILSKFERFASEIGTEAYADDLIVYPSIPQGEANNIWQIRNFVKLRLEYTDTMFGVFEDNMFTLG